MDSDLQPPPSRPLASTIGIVDEAPNLAGHLGCFDPGAQPFGSFRNLDNVAPQPHLHNATRAQDAIALEGSTQDSSNDGIALLPSTDSSFQQPSHGGLTQDPMAASFAGQLEGMKLIPDPPNLEYWRHRLFHVDEMITLTEIEYVNNSAHSNYSVPLLKMGKALSMSLTNELD